MDEDAPLVTFAEEWMRYLVGRGHAVKAPVGQPRVLLSRSIQGTRYRWLLFCSERSVKRLTAIEHEGIKRHLSLKRKGKAAEQVYVVVSFQEPVPKVVVLPAAKAFQKGRIRADKGGIPWHL